MNRLTELRPTFVDTIPEQLEHGTIYISEKYHTSIHLCACGCGEKTVMPINYTCAEGTRTTHGWDFVRIAAEVPTITFSPSVGNQQFPCRSHYFIRNNKIVWL